MLIGKATKALPSHNRNRAITIGGNTMKQEPCDTCDQPILSVWHQGMAEAAKHPALKHQLENQESELLPRFAEHYRQLKALPRRLRRSLQRQWKRSLPSVALLMALSSAGNGRDDQRGRDVYIGESHQCRQ
jgi:hypothetical protein